MTSPLLEDFKKQNEKLTPYWRKINKKMMDTASSPIFLGAFTLMSAISVVANLVAPDLGGTHDSTGEAFWRFALFPYFLVSFINATDKKHGSGKSQNSPKPSAP